MRFRHLLFLVSGRAWHLIFLIFLAGLQTISPDLYNAAKVDSTPKWRVFTKITLPGIMPMVSYALIMGMINAFKVYNEVYSLFASKAGPANSAITVCFTICTISFYNQYEYGEASASAVCFYLEFILVLTFVQRKLTGRKGWIREKMNKRKISK